MENKDLELDDVLEERVVKKKVNGKNKGNRVELELCKLLTEHFGEDFSRSVGSGNRWGQVLNMPAHAKQTLTGDICVPEGFSWVIECKGGYDDDVDFSSVLDGGCARIDEFITQSENDAAFSGRKPIVMWKRSRKPWVAMLRRSDINTATFGYMMLYLAVIDLEKAPVLWAIVNLDTLLKTTNRPFWFEEKK